MELVILLVVVLGGIGWFIWNERQHEKSGSHPLDSVTTPTAAVQPTPAVPPTPSVLDVNKDGKVDIKDAVAAVEVVKEEVKIVAEKTATKAKSTAKKVATKVKAAETAIVTEVKKVSKRKPKA
jgi:hypothetical protein